MSCAEKQPTLEPRAKYPDGRGSYSYEFHVDDSEAFVELRLQMEHRGMLKRDSGVGDKPSREDWSCEHRHTYEACRCHQAVALSGQDESIYKRYQQSLRVWCVCPLSSASIRPSRHLSSHRSHSGRALLLTGRSTARGGCARRAMGPA